MAFPYKIKQTIKFYCKDKINSALFFDELYKHIEKYDIFDKKIEKINEKKYLKFSSKNSIVKFLYHVEISVDITDYVKIEYTIIIIELFKIILLIIVIIAFFSRFSFDKFLIFSFIFTLLFYLINLIYITNQIKNIIKSSDIYKKLNPNDEDELSKEQVEWMNNPNICSACGTQINDFDKKCPDCGLYIDRKIKTIIFDKTKYKDVDLHYKFIKKKK